MALKVGFLGVAHMHAWGYLAALRDDCRATPSLVWDDNSQRRDRFALEGALNQAKSVEGLLEGCDAVIVANANLEHGEAVELATKAGKPILCEKPLAASQGELDRIENSGAKLMTAFPCRLAPAYLRLRERLRAGDIGPVKAICATNRGRCPFDWFVQKECSGGGALIDHTVHVADLFRDLLNQEPTGVSAQIGSNLHGQPWEDTAMLTLDYGGDVFATLDASWSRPAAYKTWGDVTMNVVGERGVLELDLFAQETQVWGASHTVSGYGSNLDRLLIEEWVSAILEDRQPAITMEDGLASSRVALAAYQSVAVLV